MKRRAERTRRIRQSLLAAAVVAGSLLVGCGTGSSSPQPAPTAPPATATPASPWSPPPSDMPVADAGAIVRPEESAAYVVNADGSGLRELFRDDGDGPVWIDTAPSPDGATLAVAARPMTGETRTTLYLVDTNDGSRRRVFDAPDSIALQGWSPDGTKLVVSEQLPGPVAGTPPSPPSYPTPRYRFFTPATGAMSDPVNAETGWPIGWSPDGSQFFYLRAYVNDSRIVAVDTADLSVRTVVSAPGLLNATLSPDATQVAYAAVESTAPQQPKWNIGVTDTESGGQAPRIVLRTGASSLGVSGLDWSPDGTQIAYGWTSVDADRGIYVVAASGGGAARRITTAGNRYDVNPLWSPDGRWLLVSRYFCVQCDGGGVQTVVAAAGGSSVTALEPGVDGSSSAAWAPTGATFAYGADALSMRSATDPEQGTELARFPASNYSSLIVTDTRIFFTTYTTGADVLYGVPGDGTPATVLATGYRMAVSGSGRTAQVDLDGIVIGDDAGTHHLALDFNAQVKLLTANPELAWAPDGQQLAVALNGQDGDARVGVLLVVDLPADGTWAWHAVDTRVGIAGARWSPDSTTIAYVAEDGAYVVPAAGGTPRQLSAGRPGGVDWSPDGASIAVLTGTDLRIVPVNDANPTAGIALASLAGGGGALRWSPDGARIAAVTTDGLVLIDAATGTATRIGARGVSGIVWSPDSTRLAYGHDVCGPQTCVERLTVIDVSGGNARDLVEVVGRQLVPLRWDASSGLIVASLRTGV